jgi:PPK2 family polyphosphate:nucleotide phosphotransferase
MFNALISPYSVPFDGAFQRNSAGTEPPDSSLGKKDFKRLLGELMAELDDSQRMLYAQDRYAVLLIFQGMDASGKDSTIRAVMNGVDPAGCQVFSFKQPTVHELDHDFLWRTAVCLPERGRIGIFNRSYYEEVLAVRVHTEYLEAQRLPGKIELEQLWRERMESINDHERHLARNGTVILKFWLNISKKEQRKRFLSRIDEPHKNWKFAESDVREREHWDAYMHAYEKALAATSKEWAPWYAIPADHKPYMHYCVADIIVQSLKSLGLTYPRVDAELEKKLQKMRKLLERDD